MRLLGFDIQRAPQGKSAPNTALITDTSAFSRGWTRIIEAFPGAWQRNISVSDESVLSFAAVYACVSLIASDIAKLRIKLVQQDANGIWNETDSPAFSPVLRKPNRYQTRIQFYQQWVLSKLLNGNTYVLKERDNRGVVVAQYVLDPTRVKPLVTEDGAVYYQLSTDSLSGVRSDRPIVPASEIIHDIMIAPWHPLCGISPITACGLAALQGLRVQRHSAKFFENGANPGGILSAPGTIAPELIKHLEETWEQNYGGENAGRVAVVGNGLTYTPLAMNAVDSQLVEQLKLSAETCCTAFHVPPFMVGVGPTPPYNNVEALWQQYYAQCLQTHIESIELLEDEGLGLDKQSPKMGTEFDLDSLLRMDHATRMEAAEKAIKAGASPNEVRFRYHDLGPVDGGQTPFMQEQNWPINQLASRPLPTRPITESAPLPPVSTEDEAKEWLQRLSKSLRRKSLAEGWMVQS